MIRFLRPTMAMTIVACGALISSLASAQNTTLIGNVAGSNADSFTTLSTMSTKAMGFTTSSLEYDLIEVHLEVGFPPETINTILEASLYSNNISDNPGVKLMDFETIIATSGTTGRTFFKLRPAIMPFRTFRLNANTTYWLVVRSPGANSNRWIASLPNVVPVGVATHFGARWNVGSGGLPTHDSATFNTYELQATARPSTAWYMQDPATGQIGVASYKNSHFTNWKTFPQVVGSAWEVLSFGSFGGSIFSDALLRNKSTGQLAFWYANNQNFFQFVSIPQTPPAVWQFHGSASFGDTLEYPVFQNPQSGVVVIGVHNGTQITQWRILPKVPNLAWEIVAVGDTNDDGMGDVMFRNKTTGQIAVWRTNGFDFTTWHVFPQVPSTAWDIVDIIGFPAEARGVVFQNKSTKEFAVWRLNGAGTGFAQWMAIRPQPDTKFQYKGYGYIELPF